MFSVADIILNISYPVILLELAMLSHLYLQSAAIVLTKISRMKEKSKFFCKFQDLIIKVE